MEIKEAVKSFNALAQETRLGILKHLVKKGDEGAAAGEIAEVLGAASSRLSFHLSNLENAGLIQSERQSRFIIYRANFEEIVGLIAYLLHDCCANHPTIQKCCKPKSC